MASDSLQTLLELMDGEILTRRKELAQLVSAREALAGTTYEGDKTFTTDASLIVDTERDVSADPLAAPVAAPIPVEEGSKYPYRTERAWEDAYAYSRARDWCAFSNRDVYGSMDSATAKTVSASFTRLAADPMRMLSPTKTGRGIYVIPQRLRVAAGVESPTFSQARKIASRKTLTAVENV